MANLNRLENLVTWNRWLNEYWNLQDFSSSLLGSDIFVCSTANSSFRTVHLTCSILMHKLIVFHQIYYGCQIPLNAPIRVIAEIIKLTSGYSNKTHCNNSILLARLVSMTLWHLTGMNQVQSLWFSEWSAVSEWDVCLECEPEISSRQRSLFC